MSVKVSVRASKFKITHGSSKFAFSFSHSLSSLSRAGYGLTETTAASCVMDKHDMTYGRVGAPSSLVDLRLINWEEGNYRVTNKPFPQGEIVIGSKSVAMGYYKMTGLSKENFFEEDGKRWFKTGDVGEIFPDGVLKIIGECFYFVI
jgi:long-chain acyl-CoA synthetase